MYSCGFDMLILFIGRLSKAGSLLQPHVQPCAENVIGNTQAALELAESLRTKKIIPEKLYDATMMRYNAN